MKLISLRIKNFRCYKNEVTIHFNNMTAFVGKNDAGKSTILEALEIFFNNEVVSIDRDDLNKDALFEGDSKIELTCVFDDLPNELIIDATYPTTFKSEYLLNAERLLEIKKIYSCSAAKPKDQTFIVADHPSLVNANDLLLLKRTNLKARAVELNIPPENYNATINSSMRAAIWASFENLELKPLLIPVDQEDCKKVWNYIEGLLPTYALFQSDRKSKDDDKEVTDPMKIAIQTALKDVEADLKVIQEKVHEKVIDVASRTLDKLREMSPELANELKPDFKKEPNWSSLFSLSLASDKEIPINKRGSGVRRLIVLNFFRAEAERRRHSDNSNVIYAFEEPETSQHPDHQKMLVNAFKELAESNNTQVIITTHTPFLAAMIGSEDLRFVTTTLNNEHIIEFGSTQTYDKVAKALGVLPDPNASEVKLLICVEGPNDVAFLRNISNIITEIDPALPDIGLDKRIAIFPLGGGTLKDWVICNYLSGLKKTEFHIYDLDDEDKPPYKEFVDIVCSRGGQHHAVLTFKKELENYIHPKAIERVYGIEMPIVTDMDDIPFEVAKIVHSKDSFSTPWDSLEEKKKKYKMSNAKRFLNNRVVPEMTSTELKEIDSKNEIIGWFKMIAERLD